MTALYNIIWSYIGYSNANYALSETKNPVRTLKIAGPLALSSVAVLYMFVNVSILNDTVATEKCTPHLKALLSSMLLPRPRVWFSLRQCGIRSCYRS